MTNEEAINTLKSLKDYYNDKNEDSYVGFDEKDNEALDKAIEALEQQPCEDCISRQAVIRLVEQYPNIIGNKCSGLIADIKHLPSVTPNYNLESYSDKLWKNAYERGKADAKQTEWIPVSERLPEENIHVLCRFYMGGMAECYHSHGMWHIVGGLRISCDEVVAWMPLPELYEEVEE